MRVKTFTIILAIVLFSAGCVSSGKYNAKLAEMETIRRDSAVLEEKLGNALSEKGKLETDMAGLKKTQEKLNSDKAGLEAEIAGLRKDLSALQEKLNSEKTRLDAEVTDLKGDKKSLEVDNSDLRRLLEARKGELTKEILSLKDRLKDSEDLLKVKEAEIARLMAGTEALSGEMKEKDAQVSSLKTEIGVLSLEKAKAVEEKDKAIGELKKTYDNLMSEMNAEIQKGEVVITQLKDKLSVSMVDKILFDSGSADVKKDGKKVLDRVAEILKKIEDKQIRVEGHTDNVPISSRLVAKFPTNWELSASRATNVARHLEERGIDPKRLNVAGYAEYRPIAPNDTEEGRAKNRRIEIALIPIEGK